MNQPIEGLREETRLDGRTAAGRAQRAAIRPSDPRSEQPIRDDLRSDSVRAAELRAREIEESLEGSGGSGSNELDLPANLAPDGWTYELKAMSIAGQENRHHMLGRLREGWAPVPASRHPWLMPAGHEGAIEIKGLQLMERPTILVNRAKKAEEREALDQIRNSEAKLHEAPPNTGPRGTHDKTAVRVSRDIMREVSADERARAE